MCGARCTAVGIRTCRRFRASFFHVHGLCIVIFFRGRPNALIIHYTANNQVVREDELVLLDAGCELKCVPFSFLSSRLTTPSGYASDISNVPPPFSPSPSSHSLSHNSSHLSRFRHLHPTPARALRHRSFRSKTAHRPLHRSGRVEPVRAPPSIMRVFEEGAWAGRWVWSR